MPTEQSNIRKRFFEYLFGIDEGYVCIGLVDPKVDDKKKAFKQRFFEWPKQQVMLLAFIDKQAVTQNVYFCTSLLSDQIRKKDNCLPGRIVWADLDNCKPEQLDPIPSVIIQSSDSRFQAIWRLSETVEPRTAEDYNHRIAENYKQNGVDPSGWDLTQLLRVPLTTNFKYDSKPQVALLKASEELVDTDVFENMVLKALRDDSGDEAFDQPMPEIDDLPAIENVMYAYGAKLEGTAFRSLYTLEPDKDDNWSAILWRLLSICVEAGMSNEETFAIARTAQCNKYARDQRPDKHLWRDVVKCDVAHRRMSVIIGTTSALNMPQLVPDDAGTECFIDHYCAWAEDTTDAVPAYHELAAAIGLSSLLAHGLKVPMSWGNMIPNLWGLILGDSTLTRKSTAMRMIVDLITEVDDEAILATDGSPEGLLTGLASRPHRTSMFFKDEVSGFFDSINRKEYYAGMPETLTQLYDCPPQLTRLLRKDVIAIQHPIFIFFGGGIRDKVYELVSEQYIVSGFLPRFLVVSGNADLSRMRRTGPPGPVSVLRQNILTNLEELHRAYTKTATLKIGSKTEIEQPVKFEAVLKQDAWDYFGDIEDKLTITAYESSIEAIAAPTFVRLSFSILKLGVLLAAARQEPKGNKITVTKTDLVNATRYVQKWGHHTVDLLHNAGKSFSERTLEKIRKHIEKNPGITKSAIMQNHRLWSKQADDILRTLTERGVIYHKQEGRGMRFWVV